MAEGDVKTVTKRLQAELMGLCKQKSAETGISAFPCRDRGIMVWNAQINGPKGTPYEGMEFKLSLRFPTNYPFAPPTVRFETPCFHPNVDTYGNICLDILKETWSSTYGVNTVLLSVQSLLGDPNNDSPLNTHAAQLWNNQEEFCRVLSAKYHEARRS